MTDPQTAPDPMLPAGYRRQNAEVFYREEPIAVADLGDVAFLKEQAARNPRLRSRLCMHPDPSASVHEMLIVHHRDVYVRPHVHVAKSESFHLIEGTATVVLFDDFGHVQRVLPIGARESGRPFYFRMPDGILHSFVIESEWLVFHETTQGPMDPLKTIGAPWAPEDRDVEAARAYLADLRAKVLR